MGVDEGVGVGVVVEMRGVIGLGVGAKVGVAMING